MATAARSDAHGMAVSERERATYFTRIPRPGGGWIEHLPIQVLDEPRLYTPDGLLTRRLLSHELVALIEPDGRPEALGLRPLPRGRE